ncbi:VOC family protein [Sphingobium mellinum]|uniref:VOC family protein n=1 Tax=Sphingobium mellinum TaxID=1387166 RepID=UPI0030EEA9C7
MIGFIADIPALMQQISDKTGKKYMSTITHVTVGTNDLDASRTFWDFVLEPLGIKRHFDLDDRSGYGNDVPQFIVIRPINGAPATSGNGGTIGLVAPNRASVDEFHRRALAAGGSDEGPGAERPGAPHIYAAFIRDTHGHKVGAFFVGEQ